MSKKEDNDVTEAKERFSDATDAWSENRNNALDDMRFARLGEQWPADVRADRIKAGRPCLTINKLPPIIRQVVNDGRQNRPSIEVKPVDGGADIDTANVFSGIIRNIEYASNADVAYDTALDCAVSGGFGFWRVDVDYAGPRSFDTEIRIRAIPNPLTVLMDPLTKASDSEDWRYAFITDHMPKDDFEKMFPGARSESFESAGDFDTPWWDDGAETVRLAEYYKRIEVEGEIVLMTNGLILDAAKLEDDEQLKAQLEAAGITVKTSRKIQDYKVIHQLITGAEVLEETPWAGKYIPIVPVFGEDINIEGKRYLRSLIRDARDPQQMFNYWRTTTTELVALAPKAPWIGKKGAFKTDAEKWGTANTKNHAYIEYDGTDAPKQEAFAGIPAGALQEAMNAADDIKATTGIHDASMGARSNETSGKAIMFRQREGDVSTFHFIDNLTRAIRWTGQILVDIIPKVYSEPKIMRILGDDRKPQNIAIGPQGTKPPMGQNGQPHPEIDRVYDLGVGNYDVACAAGPSFTTKREETANQMLSFMQALPQAAPLMGDMIAQNLDWKGADKLAERMQVLLPPQLQPHDPNAPPPPPPPEVQMAQAKAESDRTLAREKAMMDAELKQRESEQRIKLEETQATADREVMRQKALLEDELDRRRAEREDELDRRRFEREMAQEASRERQRADRELEKYRNHPDPIPDQIPTPAETVYGPN